MITGNEPARPTDLLMLDKDGYGDRVEFPGLTIRQQFAMAAMQGLLSNTEYANLNSMAEISVQSADALIAELNKEVKP